MIPIEQHKTMQQVCEYVGGYVGMTGREVWGSSPTGELWHIMEKYNEIKLLRLFSGAQTVKNLYRSLGAEGLTPFGYLTISIYDILTGSK